MVEVLRRLHSLGESQGPALEARLKHMQRLGFPRKRGLGRGRRATYAFDEILKVATAFQLIETGMASALAVAMVANDWGLISQALARGFGIRHRSSSCRSTRPAYAGGPCMARTA